MKKKKPRNGKTSNKESELDTPQSKLLDNIFIAISEFLVAEMIKRSKSIKTYKFKDKKLMYSTNHIFSKEITTHVGKRFHFIHENRECETDEQHKIDVLIERKSKRISLAAIEVKAGTWGAAENPNEFIKHVNKKKVELKPPEPRSQTGQKVSGRMASVLCHNVKDPNLKYDIRTQIGKQQIKINERWYLCLRNSTWLGRESHSRYLDDVFKNCSIIFLNEIADKIGSDNFKEILEEIAPSLVSDQFVQEMWMRANPSNSKDPTKRKK